MKARGLESPYLKAFVVARINPLRFQRKPTADFDETIDKMLGSARRFDAGKIKADQVARTGGAPADGGVSDDDARALARAAVHRPYAGRRDVPPARRARRARQRCS